MKQHPSSKAVAAAVAIFALIVVGGCGKSNRPPVIEAFDGSPPFGDAPVDMRLFWTISDPDGDVLTCRIDLDGDGQPEATLVPCTSEDVYTTLLEIPGRHLVTLTVDDGTTEVSRTVELFANRCVFQDYTVWPEQEVGFGGAILHEDGTVELEFFNVSTAPIISQDDILWGTSAGGYLRRVIAPPYFVVSVHSKRYVLQTEQAHPEEAVVECQYGIRNYQMRFIGAECTEDCDGLESITPLMMDAIAPKGGMSVGQSFSFESVSLGGFGELKPSVDISIEISRAYVDFGFLHLREFTFEAKPKVTFKGNLNITAGGASWDHEWPLCGPIIMSAVAIGPLVFTPTIELTADVHLGLEPKLTFGFDAGMELTGGISYLSGEGTSAWGGAQTFAHILDPSIKLGVGDARLGLKGRAAFLLYGLIGPYVGGHVYVKGDLSADLDEGELCLEGTVGIDAIYGVQLNLFFTQINQEGSTTLATRTFYNECWGGYLCGDGVCDEDIEDCISCPSDCQTCPPACGDGVVEGNEICDPPSTCPASIVDCDDGDPCTVEDFWGSAASCNSQCFNDILMGCTDGDGCCAMGCNVDNDDDCSPACGNSVLDAGETCDPPGTCATTCQDADPCTVDTMTGSPATCDVVCDNAPITSCVGSDGCCPAGCDSGNDSDCSAYCGNGVVDSGESCDPPSSCPTSCDDGEPCTTDSMVGSAATCNLQCYNDLVFFCSSGDGCCAAGCNQATDSDCSSVCGNSVCEPSEDCGSCEADCGPCSVDPCAGFTGTYCGATAQFPEGTSGTLYSCTGGVTQSTTVCSNGCVVALPGLPDYCGAGSCNDYGEACSSDSACCSGYCTSGHCCETGGMGAPGDSCGGDSACCSGNCDAGTCCYNATGPFCIM